METEQELTWRLLRRVPFEDVDTQVRNVSDVRFVDELNQSGWTFGEYQAEASRRWQAIFESAITFGDAHRSAIEQGLKNAN